MTDEYIDENTVFDDSHHTTKQLLDLIGTMTPSQLAEWNERELKRQQYDNPKPDYPGGPTYYDEHTQIWDD